MAMWKLSYKKHKHFYMVCNYPRLGVANIFDKLNVIELFTNIPKSNFKNNISTYTRLLTIIIQKKFIIHRVLHNFKVSYGCRLICTKIL